MHKALVGELIGLQRGFVAAPVDDEGAALPLLGIVPALDSQIVDQALQVVRGVVGP
jgi:hypothetical protein